MMTTARDHLSRSDAVTVARIEAAVPDLAAACALTGRFANMVRNGEHDNPEEWLSEAGGSLLASLARGLNADKHAVLAALREPWSNGQTEGQINKLKALKRQMLWTAPTSTCCEHASSPLHDETSSKVSQTRKLGLTQSR